MILDDEIAKYLKDFCMGEQAAVTSRTLEGVFHIRGPDLRCSINRLRSEGVPICSFDSGYYYAKTKAELQQTVHQLRSRIKKIAHAERGLTRTLEAFCGSGQITLDMGDFGGDAP